MTTVAQLTIEMAANVARLSTDMDAARRKVDSTFGTISQSVGVLKNTLGGLFAGISVVGLVQMAKAAINAVDAMNDVADATGATVEKISAMQDVARRTGTSMDTVTTALVKFNSTLKDADPTKGPGAVLKALGLEVKALKQLDPAEAMLQTAKALAKFADDGAKARAVQELFGKSIKEVAPLLNDLAKAGQLNATVTTEQAIEAEKFNQQLFQLQTTVSDTARSILMKLVPAINRVFGDIGTLGEKFSLAQLAGEVRGLDSDLKSLQSRKATAVFVPADIDRQISDTAARLEAAKKKFNAALGTTSPRDALRAFENGERASNAPQLKLQDPASSNSATASKAASEARRQEAEALRKVIDLAEYRNRLFDEEADKQEASRLTVEGRIRDAREMLEAIEQETRLMGLSSLEREKAVALIELERQGIVKGTEAYEKFAPAILKAIEARSGQAHELLSVDEIIEEAAKTAKTVGRNTSTTLADSISQGILEGARSGASIMDIFRRELEAQFARTILRPLIQPVAEGLNSAISAGLNALLNAFGGGAASSGYNPGSGLGFGTNFEQYLPSFAGGGHTGNSARSGGLDGQGGFMAMLHPRERVLDEAQGQGAVINVKLEVINNAGVQVQHQSRTGADGTQILSIVLSAVGDALANRSGPVARGLEAGYPAAA